MSRFIRVATAGCVVLGLSLLFGTPAAQAKGGGSHSGSSHSGKHMGSKDHRNHRVDFKHRRRNDWRYRNYRGYGYGYGCGYGNAVQPCPAPMCDQPDCMPTPEGGYMAGGEGGSCGDYGFGKYRRDRYHGHGVSYRGGMSRGGHSGGHGRK